MKIKIFTTGGTIDDVEYETEQSAPKRRKSFVPDLLKKARVILEYDVEELMAKDSKFLSEKDREKIIEKCISAKEDRIIITHGAYTMALTAKKLGKAGIGKTIVLTGSMIPANKPESDALFNLGKALGVVQTLPTGVYIAMNGRVFNWQNVKKNARSGSFEEEK